MRDQFNKVKSYQSCFQFLVTDKRLNYTMMCYEGGAV